MFTFSFSRYLPLVQLKQIIVLLTDLFLLHFIFYYNGYIFTYLSFYFTVCLLYY